MHGNVQGWQKPMVDACRSIAVKQHQADGCVCVFGGGGGAQWCIGYGAVGYSLEWVREPWQVYTYYYIYILSMGDHGVSFLGFVNNSRTLWDRWLSLLRPGYPGGSRWKVHVTRAV